MVKIFGINYLYTMDDVINKVDIRFEYRTEGTYLNGNTTISKVEYDANSDLELLKALVLSKIENV